MILSTTPTLETHAIREYLGVVAGEAGYYLSDRPSDMAASNSRDLALRRLSGAAEALGGDAVVGISLDHQGTGHGHILVVATGTAVVVDDEPGIDPL